MSERSDLLGRLRLVAVYVFIAVLVVLSRPTSRSYAIGLILAVTGESMRLWAAGHLVKSVRLITSGPYAYTQNPLYLGRLLILTGLAIATPAPAFLNLIALAVGYAVFFLYYIPRKIRVEGGRLARLHGAEFETYHRSVPILFPGFRRFPGAATGPWSFRQMVTNQEPIVVVGLALAFGLLFWKLHRA